MHFSLKIRLLLAPIVCKIISYTNKLRVTTRNVQITSHNIQFNDIHGPTGLTASD